MLLKVQHHKHLITSVFFRQMDHFLCSPCARLAQMLIFIKKSPCSGHIGSEEVSVHTIVLVSCVLPDLSCENHGGITALAGY